MNITKQGSFWCASRITGPNHNFLRLAFAQGAGQQPLFEALPPVGGCEHKALDPNAVFVAVLEGVALGNERFGTDYQATAIQYISNDTPPEGIYSVLAFEIVKSLAESR